ncbi:MAG: glutamate--cysteine ligase, partial [Sphingobium sp.]
MSTRTDSGGNDPVIESREQLIAAFAKGEKPKDRWRIGTEHEKFVYARSDHHAPSYEEKGGIHTLLIGLTRYGWQPVFEGENIIALSGADGTISLEP